MAMNKRKFIWTGLRWTGFIFVPTAAFGQLDRRRMSLGALPVKVAASSPIALIAHAATNSGGVNTSGTTAAVDTTGATLLIAIVTDYDVMPSALPTDSKSNTWTLIRREALNAGTGSSNIYYVNGSPTVGSGHTFEAALTGGYPAIAILAFSNTLTSSVLDQQNGHVEVNSAATSLQPGSVTPTQDNEVIVAGLNPNAGASVAIDSGFTIADSLVTGSNFGVASAYKIQTTAAAVNPTWTFTAGNVPAGVISTFKHA